MSTKTTATTTTAIEEIADGIHRICTWTPEVTPEGFTFNQFLIVAEEPLLFHTGPRSMFGSVAEAVGRVLPVESLRWISFGHVEGDECGSVNRWLDAAPRAEVAHHALGCDISLNDLCDRPPRALDAGEVIDLGGKRVRFLPTPHVPHNWEAQVLFEETTGTLLCGDLLSTPGGGPALTEGDLVERSIDLDRQFGVFALGPGTGDTIRGLADLQPSTLAIMHGSSFAGDGAGALRAFAAGLEQEAASR